MKSNISSFSSLLIISQKKDNKIIENIFRQYSYDKKLKKTNKYKYILTFMITNVNNDVKNKEYLKSKSASFKINKNFYDRNDKLYKKDKRPYYRKIYSNEYIKFENEINKIPHYIKKYKEDDITFTKNKILPEIKWQNYDSDVLTSEEQKKYALKKEIKNLEETIKRIQNNENFFKYNVSMYKLSQKFPKPTN